jgi:hypothetical protein
MSDRTDGEFILVDSRLVEIAAKGAEIATLRGAYDELLRACLKQNCLPKPPKCRHEPQDNRPSLDDNTSVEDSWSVTLKTFAEDR